MDSLDSAIISTYRVFNTPADRIVTDPQIDQDFVERVNKLLRPDDVASLAEINRRLLNLRRLGEAKGGLPRLQRRYNGRNHNVDQN